MMSLKTVRGKTPIIGPSIKQSYPITLDPNVYEGAIVYADADFANTSVMYYSDGNNWVEIGTNIQGLQGPQGPQGLHFQDDAQARELQAAACWAEGRAQARSVT
jgi:hypothetical protein